MVMKTYKDLLPGEVLDLSKEIALLTPTDTPLLTLLYGMGRVVPASDIMVSWREKQLANVKNLKLEGAEAGAPINSTRTMKTNICQIMEKVVSVSGTLNALNPNGVGNEFTAEVSDRLAELKMDLEYYAINGVYAVENGATPRQMAGLKNLVNESNVISGKALTYDVFVDALQSVWAAGARGEMYCFVNATQKRAINKLFAAEVQQTVQPGANQTFGVVVSRIITDFGVVNVVLDRHMNSDEILIVDLNQVELAELRPAQYSDLAKTGDYKKGQIVSENTIKLLNTKAGAVIKGIITA